MFLKLILIFVTLDCDPCNFQRGPAENLTACLRTIDDVCTASEMNDIIDTVITYTQSNPYQLMYMNAPNGIESFDAIFELTELKSQVNDTGCYDIFEKISNIMKKFRDCHVFVTLPFLDYYAYYVRFPLFTIVQDNEVVFVSQSDSDDLFVVTHIDMGAGVQPVEKAISDFVSAEVGNSGYDPHVQFNSFFRGGSFPFFSLATTMFRPEERYNPYIKAYGFSVDNESNSVTKEFPWEGIYGGEPNPNVGFEELNPKISSSFSLSSSSSSSSSSYFHSKKEFQKFSEELLKEMKFDKENILQKLNLHFSTSSHSHSLSHSHSHSNPSSIRFDEDGLLLEYNNNVFLVKDTTNKIGYLKLANFMPTNVLMTWEEGESLVDFYTEFGKAFRSLVDSGVKDLIIDIRSNGGGSLGVLETLLDFFFHNTIYPAVLEMDMLKTPFNDLLSQLYPVIFSRKIFRPDTGYKINDFYNQKNVTRNLVNAAKTNQDKVTMCPANYTERLAADHSLVPPNLAAAFGGDGYSPFDSLHTYIATDGVAGSCGGMFPKQALEMKAARVFGFGYNPNPEFKDRKYYPGHCAGGAMQLDWIEVALQSGLLAGLDTSAIKTFPRQYMGMGWTHYQMFSRNPSHFGQSLYFVNASVQDVFPFGGGPNYNPNGKSFSDWGTIATAINDKYISTGRCLEGEVKVDPVCTTPDRAAKHQLWGRPCAVKNSIDIPNLFSETHCAFAFCELGFFLNGTSTEDGSGVCLRIPPVVDDPGNTGNNNTDNNTDNNTHNNNNTNNTKCPSKSVSKKIPGWGVALIILAVVLSS